METAEAPKKSPLRLLKTLKRAGIMAAALLVVGGACWIGGSIAASAPKEEPPPQISAVVLEERLASISELATVTYSYTNMGQFASSNDFYGVKVPFTTKSFILTYDGVIKAGVDLSGAQISLSQAPEAVAVTLPRPKILSHEIDEDSLEVFDEKTSIFNPFTVSDYSAFRADQQREMETKALAAGLLTEAGEKACRSVELLLAAALPEGCSLTVQITPAP